MKVKDILDIANRALVLVLLCTAVVFVATPGAYGAWLKKLDDARYYMVDCDCTEALE